MCQHFSADCAQNTRINATVVLLYIMKMNRGHIETLMMEITFPFDSRKSPKSVYGSLVKRRAG